MLQLLMLWFIVVGIYGALTFLNTTVQRVHLSRSLRGRISLASFFIFTGIGHFFMPEEMAQMLPPFIPERVMIIYVTGILEILGAIGLLFPGLERLSSVALILFLIGVLPANIYAAVTAVDFGGHVYGPVYLLARIPFQLFLIGWAYYFGLRMPSRHPWGGWSWVKQARSLKWHWLFR